MMCLYGTQDILVDGLDVYNVQNRRRAQTFWTLTNARDPLALHGRLCCPGAREHSDKAGIDHMA